MPPQTTATEAIAANYSPPGLFRHRFASFICPHCGVYALHYWGIPGILNVPLGGGAATSRQVSSGDFVFAHCVGCSKESVFVDRALIHPRATDAPKSHPDLPPELAADFEEARQVSGISPRGAAALLRLVIQKLCPLIGAEVAKIDRMIAQLVRENKIAPAVQQALDSVRVIGNEAVHPGELDLRDDAQTVHSLFSLVNFVVEKTISEPRQIAGIFAGLPANKLAGIEQRDRKA